MIGPAWNPGARVMLDVSRLGGPSQDPWPCTVIQSTATHALVVPDTPWRTSSGSFIQPWVALDLLTPQSDTS